MTETIIDPEQLSHASAGPGAARYAPRVLSRYKSAYRVARTIVQIGFLVKIVSEIVVIATIALIVITLSLRAPGSHPSHRARNSGWEMPGFATQPTGEFATIASVVYGFSGLGVAAVIYIFGLLISARGQMLKAALDGSVNTSPFLTDEQRAKVMSLG